MRIVRGLLAIVLAATCFCTAAWADVNWGDAATAGSDTTAAPSGDNAAASADAAADNAAAAPAVDSYGRSPCDVAVNQGIVAYWYAHGYANCNGGFPAKLADLSSMGLPLRKWVSPHTGDAIDPDDGKLDFLGDFTYTTGCNDVSITVLTAAGEVNIPGTFTGTDGCNTRCCNISICGFECWKCCGQECVCKIIQWMMYKSFETYYCMYGEYPCDDMMWIASGLAPIDKNWKEMAPFMTIDYVWTKCCTIKKAKVNCCACSPCVSRCNTCAKPACGSCNKCGGSCKSCSKCNTCGKPACGSCNKCNSCAKPSCNSCAKPSCSSCGKPACSSCNKCNSCAKPSCSKCGSAKPACGSCNKCGGSCKSCNKCSSCGKSACGSCNKCSGGASKCNSCAAKTCNSCNKCSKSSSCAPKCNSCSRDIVSSCNSCGGKVNSRMWDGQEG